MKSHAIHTVIAVLLVAACGNASDVVTDTPDESRNVDGIVYSAETAILESFPVQLRTTVSAANPGGDAVRIRFPDGCIVTLRAYRDETRDGDPAWDQARTRACTMAIEERTVPGGGSLMLEAATDARDILGDSLPDGRYWLTTLLRPAGEAVEVPAGATDLAVPR